jgi:YD repeat-containing protein
VSSTSALTTTFQYAYDAVGNRTTQTATITSTQVTNYVYDAANRLTSVNGQAYTWDDNGNLVNDGTKAYTFDQANRMKAVNGSGASVTYAYNGEGVRLKQIVNSTVTTYTQDLAVPLPVVLQSKTGANAMQYVYALGTRPLAQYGSAWEYLLADALGSVRQIVDANGNVTLAESYAPATQLLQRQAWPHIQFIHSQHARARTGPPWPKARNMGNRPILIRSPTSERFFCHNNRSVR